MKNTGSSNCLTSLKKNETIFSNFKPLGNQNISVLLINARSIKKHDSDLEALVYSFESLPCIICVTETWLIKSARYACRWGNVTNTERHKYSM